MISISLSTALIIYSTIVFVGAVGIWLYTEITTRRAYLVLEKQYVWHCVFCSYTYLDTDATKHSKCPQCESINSLKDSKARYVPLSGVSLDDETDGDHQESRRNQSKGKKKGARSRGPRKRSR